MIFNNNKIKIHIEILLALTVFWGNAVYGVLPLPSTLIDLNSPAGQQLLYSSEHREHLWPLMSYFESQKNRSFCSVASLVSVLNSFGIPAPVDPNLAPYAYFTQDDFFTPQVQKIITPQQVLQNGMMLDQLNQVIQSFSLQTTKFYASETSYQQFLNEVIPALSDPNSQVLVNFYRPSLHLPGGGHISPLAVYNKAADSFLLLDVARFKYPPYWVKSKDLWDAMNTIDPKSGKSRGFIIINNKVKLS